MTRTRVFMTGFVSALCLVLSIPAAAPVSAGGRLEILAPAETAIPIRSLVAAFEAAHPGTHVAARFVPASRLDRETDRGLDCDLVILTDYPLMKALGERLVVDPASIRIFAVDRLVLCAPAYQPLGNLQELAGEKVRHIAIVNPSRGESGMLAVLALNRAGVWAGVQPKIVHGDDSREVLEFMEKHAVQAGLLYWSQAAGNPYVRVVGTFERPYSDPIRYGSAVSSRTGNAAAARDFQQYLASADAQGLLKSLGYHSE